MNHPLTPPPGLVEQWRQEAIDDPFQSFSQGLAISAAQWGADQELDACCEWLERWCRGEHPGGITNLREARRPKPQPLREQAMEALERMHDACLMTFDSDIIRRALEALPDERPD
jgi:hypothetical protein